MTTLSKKKNEPNEKKEDTTRLEAVKEIDGLESFPTFAADIGIGRESADGPPQEIRSDILERTWYNPNIVVKQKRPDLSSRQTRTRSYSRPGQRIFIPITFYEVEPDLGMLIHDFARGDPIPSLLGTVQMDARLKEHLRKGDLLGIGTTGRNVKNCVVEKTYFSSEPGADLDFAPRGDVKVCLTHYFQNEKSLFQNPTEYVIALFDLERRVVAYVRDGNENHLKICIGRMKKEVSVESPDSQFRYDLGCLARLYLIPSIKKFGR